MPPAVILLVGDDSVPIISCYVHWTLKTEHFVCTMCVLDFWSKDEFPIKPKSHSNSLWFPLTMDEKWTQMKIFNLFIWCLHELFSDPVLWCCKIKTLLSGWLKIEEQTFLMDARSGSMCLVYYSVCHRMDKLHKQLCTFNAVRFLILIR